MNTFLTKKHPSLKVATATAVHSLKCFAACYYILSPAISCADAREFTVTEAVYRGLQ
jgi:hypothetical protein